MPQAPARRDTSEASDVAALVRLHHRRRGWAWVAAGSVIGLVVAVAISVSLPGKFSGTAEALSVIPVIVLVMLAVVGLVVVIVDTALIHRADAAARVSAKRNVSHYPLYAHAHSYPPHHRGSWVFAVVMLVAMTGFTVYFLPAEVNAWAYATGAAHRDTFSPVSYGQACGGVRRAVCHIVTDGYLSRGDAPVIWGSQVPLGQPFTVRDPIWTWGTGRTLISGKGAAAAAIAVGLFFDTVALLLLYVLVVIVRGSAPGREHRVSVPAGAHPGGAHPAHHPDGRHPGSGNRRPARRKPGKR